MYFYCTMYYFNVAVGFLGVFLISIVCLAPVQVVVFVIAIKAGR